MSIPAPSIPKGTRDFSPVEMQRRNFIFDTIREVYTLYGYQPVETPAMENLSTLLGKYGDEGDKLLFKIVNSGDFLSAVGVTNMESLGSAELAPLICDRGLRYDLTVPFARFVVQHRNKIKFPFKRYQIQPVWRADRPQKGRYREFYQCDADVIGSNSLLSEYELLLIIKEVFSRLNVSNRILINNRKLLSGIAEVAGVGERITDITTEIDKIGKIGMNEVVKNLTAKGIPESSIAVIRPLLELTGSNSDKMERLSEILSNSATGMRGVEEMSELLGYLKEKESDGVIFDLSLARGLNYYTGAIIEVKAEDSDIGSICGGGRYDDLTGVFGLSDTSGVGISFGADRIYDVMLQNDLFPQAKLTGTSALVVNFGGDTTPYALGVVAALRRAGIRSELYPDSVRLKKQFSYANANKIPWIIVAGEDEMAAGKVKVKEMDSGSERDMTLNSFIDEYGASL